MQGRKGAAFQGRLGGRCQWPGLELGGPDVNSCGRDSESPEGLEVEPGPDPAADRAEAALLPGSGIEVPSSELSRARQAVAGHWLRGSGDGPTSALEDALGNFLQRFFA